jgi:hypothetical protein
MLQARACQHADWLLVRLLMSCSMQAMARTVFESSALAV